jgi:DNA-binding CsgD family transcriptional regulator
VIDEYRALLERRAQQDGMAGFEPLWMPDSLFGFQGEMTGWSVRMGRSALLADCGLGKSPMELTWAQNVYMHTGRPVLLQTPLGVTSQMCDEAAKFGIEAAVSRSGEIPAPVTVTNYERLHHFDRDRFGGVVCDESSCLKSFDGKRRALVTEFLRPMPYRLLAPATAAPNDYAELGTSSEALGYLGHVDMLSRFFTRDPQWRVQGHGAPWRFKGHAQEPFWRWVASWARAMRRPSDLGFPDDGFILPPLAPGSGSAIRWSARRPTSRHQPRTGRRHTALAEVTDPQLDPDRRAWHRAQAAPGPDEDVAAELERSASRAQARGGLAAAAAFLERAAVLTLDPAHRAGRALAAGQAKIQAGALDAALDLLEMAESGPLSDFQHARADLVRAQLAFVTSRGTEAPPLLLKAARRLELIDPGLSRATYLDALSAAIFTGRLARRGSGVLEVARAAGAAPPPPRAPRAPDLLLDGLAAHYNEGYAAGVPTLRRALAAFGVDMSVEEELHWLWPACVAAAIRVWDDDRWDVLSARHVQLARETGALSELPLALTSRAYMLLFAGDLSAAASLTAETQAVKEATGSSLAAPYGAFGLAALRGDEAGALALIDATIKDATRRGEGVGITFAEWANAALNNGLGNYGKAVAAAQRACSYDDDLGSLLWVTAELIEAAARTGMTGTAASAYDRLEEMTSASDTDWGLGIRARSCALLSEGETAERLYRESIARLSKTRLRVDLARAHLLYGEWLRRDRRPSEAREQLRTAHGMLEAMGVAAFAERARSELRAAGGTVRKRTAAARHEELTAQEAQIARLARDGLSNPEIGTRLFISARTVQYHLRKVFTKLGITSRTQLDSVLSRGPATSQRPR